MEDETFKLPEAPEPNASESAQFEVREQAVPARPEPSASGMRLALVHDFIYTFGGAEQVLKELHEMFPEAPIYTAFVDPAVVAAHFPHARIITSSVQKSPLKSKPYLFLKRMTRAVEEWDFSEYDTVISSSGAFSHGIITGPDTFHLCYCHSPMRYAWDWHAKTLGDRGITGPMAAVVGRVMSGVRLWDSVSAKRVDVWLANSHTVAARIKKYYRADATVVYPPVATGFETSPVRKDYVLTLGRLVANKHVDLMIKACHDAGITLAIAGEGKDRAKLEAQVRESSSNVHFLGRISDAEKFRLLGEASAFLFAAEDDFGIAPVEALAAGTPVIALGKGGVTETVQDGKNGLFFPEQTAESLLMALHRFRNNEIKLDSEAIKQTAQPFSKEAFRTGILKALNDRA